MVYQPMSVGERVEQERTELTDNKPRRIESETVLLKEYELILDDNKTLFIIEPNGKKRKIDENVSGDELKGLNPLYHNGNVYYNIFSNHSNNLYKYHLSTSEKTHLYNDVRLFGLAGDYLFYLDSQGAYLSNLIIIEPSGMIRNATKKVQNFNQQVNTFYHEGYIYYIAERNDKDYICRYSLSDSKETLLSSESDEPADLGLNGDNLYYIKNGKELIKSDLTNTNKKTIHATRSDRILFNGEWLNNKIYRFIDAKDHEEYEYTDEILYYLNFDNDTITSKKG
jgi:transposase-like protein/ASC-1-like (ASCH) protein